MKFYNHIKIDMDMMPKETLKSKRLKMRLAQKRRRKLKSKRKTKVMKKTMKALLKKYPLLPCASKSEDFTSHHQLADLLIFVNICCLWDRRNTQTKMNLVRLFQSLVEVIMHTLIQI